jgi:hypothetical protein
MTLSRERLSAGLQVSGLAGSVGGVLATPFFGLASAMEWAAAGLVAVLLDLIAFRSRSDTRAMLAQLGKIAVIVAAVALVPASTDPSGGSAGTIIPPDLGPMILLLSILPSTAGAMVRRSDPPAAVRP